VSETRASTATIKFGAGYEAPWFVASGTPAEIREQLVEAFGLVEPNAGTLEEVITACSVIALHQYNLAVEAGAAPATTIQKPKGPAQFKPGIAAQAKASEPEVEDPPLDQLIKSAASEEELGQIWKDNQSVWTPEYTELAAQRKKELAG
jgi:hypothetical protein